MIEGLSQWVKNLIFLVLFAAFMELLLPSQSMQKFLRVVIGLLIMLAVLKPVAALMEYNMQPGDLPAFSAIESGGGAKAPRVQSMDRDRLARAVYQYELARQMQATVETVPEVAAAKAEIVLSEKSGEKQAGEIERVVIAVKAESGREKSKIEVRLGENKEDAELKPTLRHRILRRVCEIYQIPEEKIEINGWQ